MNKKNNKNLLLAGLTALMLVMAIGYAAFATQLNINGSAAITSNWCIGFDNTKTSDFVPSKGVPTGQAPTGSVSYSGNTCATIASTVATLNSTLHQPGDKVVYTLTILNKGSVDASINSILVDDVVKTTTYTETKGNIKFTVTMPNSNTVVATTGLATMTVVAEFQNDTPVSSLDQAETQSISIKVNAGQV